MTENYAKMLAGYESTIETVEKELFEALKCVSDLSYLDRSTLKAIATRAAELWMAYMAQRCRLVIQDSKGTISHANDAWEGKRDDYDLVVRPEVRRIGNQDGKGFGIGTVIDDCRVEYFPVALPTS
jgi:hypothetical protein